MRTISKKFQNDLADGILKPLVDYVKDYENKVILCIRKNYVSMYYKGHSLLRIIENQITHDYNFEYDLKHIRYTCGLKEATETLKKIEPKITVSKNLISSFECSSDEVKLPTRVFKLIEMFKKYIDDYFDTQKTTDKIREENGEEQTGRGKSSLIEKLRQQEIYTLSMRYADNGYICYDRESAIEGEDIKRIFGPGTKLGQPDCLFAKITNGIITKIMFVEIKSTKKACLSNTNGKTITSGIWKHDNDFSKMLGNAEIRNLLVNQLLHVSNVYRVIGLNNYPDTITVSENLEFDTHYIFTDEAIMFTAPKRKPNNKDYDKFLELKKRGKTYIY